MFHKIVIIAALLFNSLVLFSQKTNQFNHNGQRTGKWIVYLDSAKTIKSIEGKYRKGKPKGTFFYYTNEGVLERKEISRFSKLKTTTYYSDQTIRSKGQARIENLPDKIHYYYFGQWKYYDKNGKLEKYCSYEKGNLVKTVYADRSIKWNDSLIQVLNAMDAYFNKHNAVLLDSISLSAFNISRRERLQLELYMSDTLTYGKLSTIFSRFGYPSKSIAHETCIIPFYLLSFAPVGIREKYLYLLVDAANKGDLEWKSLAFYIDKLELAKGGKQIYGTQYYYKANQMVYYPVKDPETLESRRKQIGL